MVEYPSLELKCKRVTSGRISSTIAMVVTLRSPGIEVVFNSTLLNDRRESLMKSFRTDMLGGEACVEKGTRYEQ